MGELIYQVYDLKLHDWLTPVSGGFDFSGNFGNPIGAIKLSIRDLNPYSSIIGFGQKEILTYRVHTKSTIFYKGRWSEFASNDHIAGDCRHIIDAIVVKSNKRDLIVKTHNYIDNTWADNLDDVDTNVSGVYNMPIDIIKVYPKLNNTV